MRSLMGVGILLATLLAASAASAAETARVERVEGKITYRSAVDGALRKVKTDLGLRKGDVVYLADRSSMTVTFRDGSEMHLTGPAAFRLRLLDRSARTVELLAGTINRFVVRGTTTGIISVCKSFCALKFGEVFVRADVGARTQRAVYKLFKGDDARVGQAGKHRPLKVEKPAVFECDACAPYCDRPGLFPEGPNEMTRMKIGDRIVELSPPAAFTIEKTPDGGVVITSTVPEGSFGVITLDDYTTFYLGTGQSIYFGPGGEVFRHTGIIHIYGPLDRRGLYDDPVEGPADSSFAGTIDR